MSNASHFSKAGERWTHELWNLSLLPEPAANRAEIREQEPARLTPRRLENLAETQTSGAFSGALRIMRAKASDTLSRPL